MRRSASLLASLLLVVMFAVFGGALTTLAAPLDAPAAALAAARLDESDVPWVDPEVDITETMPIPAEYGDFVPQSTVKERSKDELAVCQPHVDFSLGGVIGYPLQNAQLVFDAFGLVPGSRVNIQMRSTPVPIASVVVGDNGSVIFTAKFPATIPAGKHAIYARGYATSGGVLPERVERIATVIVGAEGVVLGLRQDRRDSPEPGSPVVFPKDPVAGRGNTTIATAENGDLLYLNRRVSTSPFAAAVPKASSVLSAPGTYSGGLVTVLLLAIIGVALEFPFNWIQERAKGYYLELIARLRGGKQPRAIPRVLGVRIDVIAFLFVGQMIAALNAPLEALPPFDQVAKSALFGAIAVFAISGWYALPHVLLHRRADGDIGDFQAEWPSLMVAAVALIAAQLSGIVPGFIIGLFTVRRFRNVLPEAQTARGALTATVLLVLFAIVSWFIMDSIDTSILDSTNPLRVVIDGVFGVILVAGTQGALLNLLDPGDDFAMTLRRTSMPLWLLAIALSGGISFAFLVNGKIDIALFAPPENFGEYASLLAFAAISLGIIAALHRAAERYRGASRSTRAA